MRLSRRRFVASSTIAVASGLLMPRLPLWAEEADGLRDLHGGVGIFTARGGTIGWMVADEALVVVDSQFPASAESCLAGLRRKSERTIDALFNTHHHYDHTSGNGVFKPEARTIVAHENVPGLQLGRARHEGNESEQTYADTTFAESWSIELGRETVTARHFGPAHTGGDSVVHFQEANVVHLGDLVFNRWHPFIDRPGGASVRGWADVLQQVIERYGEALYVFGHGHEAFGVTGSVKDVALQRDFFHALLDAARRGLKEGKSAEELGKAGKLPGFEDHESPGTNLSLAANIRVAYEELKGDR